MVDERAEKKKRGGGGRSGLRALSREPSGSGPTAGLSVRPCDPSNLRPAAETEDREESETRGKVNSKPIRKVPDSRKVNLQKRRYDNLLPIPNALRPVDVIFYDLPRGGQTGRVQDEERAYEGWRRRRVGGGEDVG